MATGIMPEYGLLINNLYAPKGTRIPMQQVAPPLGWTSDVSAGFTDCSMRINSGSGGGTGGTTAWSQWNFGGSFNVNTFTLSIAQLAAHTHSDTGHVHGVNDPGHGHSTNAHNHTTGSGFAFWTATPGGGNTGQSGPSYSQNLENNTGNTTVTVNSAGSNISLQTSFANLANTGSGAGITPTFNTPQVRYADHIIAVKS